MYYKYNRVLCVPKIAKHFDATEKKEEEEMAKEYEPFNQESGLLLLNITITLLLIIEMQQQCDSECRI